MLSRNSKTKEITFQKYENGPYYENFKPNLTPKEMFEMGSFGGTYWREIYSSINKKSYKNEHKKFNFLKNIDNNLLTRQNYDRSINKYKVKVGSTLEIWESKGWIKSKHPYGWVQWYCDFYHGKRSSDDERQIDRWIKTAGPKSRWRRRLINLLREQNSSYDDFTVSPVIRQILQHWGYILTKKDFIEAYYKIDDSKENRTNLHDKTVKELKNILRSKNLKVSGKKSELIERINNFQ